MILNLDDAPDTPLERLIWLGGVKQAVEDEMQLQWEQTYFEARMSGLLDAALALRLHSKKKVMAFTRRHNFKTGSQVRWWKKEPART